MATARKTPQRGDWAYTSIYWGHPLIVRKLHEATRAAHEAVCALDLADHATHALFSPAKREIAAASVVAYDTWQALEALLCDMVARWESGQAI